MRKPDGIDIGSWALWGNRLASDPHTELLDSFTPQEREWLDYVKWEVKAKTAAGRPPYYPDPCFLGPQ